MSSPTRKLRVIVRAGRLTSKYTSYCVCTILDAKADRLGQPSKTEVTSSTTVPTWDHQTEFEVNNEFNGIKVECFEKRKIRADKIIGQCTLKINPDRLDAEEIKDEWFPLTLNQKNRGEIQLRLFYADRENRRPMSPAIPRASSTVAATTTANADNNNNNNNNNTTTVPATAATSETTTSQQTTTATATTTTATTAPETPVPATTATVVPTTTTTTTSASSSASTSAAADDESNSASSEEGGSPSTPPITDKSDKSDEPNPLKSSATWQDPSTEQNLLKRSYVIIDEPTESTSSTSSGRKGLTTSTHNAKLKTLRESSDNDNEDDDDDAQDMSIGAKDGEEEEDEEEDDAEDNDDDGDEDEDNGGDVDMEDTPEDYGDWDAMEEEEMNDVPAKPVSLTTSGIFKARESKIAKVRDILGVPSHIAQALLQFYKWDEEKFLMRFLENPAAIYKEAKVEAPSAAKDDKSQKEIFCSVCYEDNKEDITALSCGHYFCNGCWSTHIGVAIKEGRAVDITCMQLKCKELIPDYIVRKIVGEGELYEKYATFLSKAFVETNANVKWCPRAGCTNAVDSSQCMREGKCVVAKCECGYKFCFLCSEEAHTPAGCANMKEWAKKCADDSETYNWIAANTKDCPSKNCGVPIEKNDGCFMMTCQKCRFQFCWLCCEAWSSHNDHFSCNRYKEGKLENKPSWMDGRSNTDARQALDRYLFYYNRYINHQNSLKFEARTRERAKKTMETMQQNGTHSYIDVQFVESALNQLLECRRTLRNTYVYAFYQSDPLKKDLFEFSQADLEKITEKIAQMLEKISQCPPDQLLSLSSEVKSLTQVATRSLHHLLYDENL